MSNTEKLIAVVGATGQQGGAVVRALKASGQFKVRALTRDSAKHLGSNSRDAIALANKVAGQDDKFFRVGQSELRDPRGRLKHHSNPLPEDFTMKRLVITSLLFASLSAFAANGEKVSASEKYDIDASHSGIVFGWNHFGFSNPTARFDKIEGSVQLDKADLSKSSVSVTLPLDGLDTGVPKLDEYLKSPDFLDATQYPTVTFKSTRVEKVGENGLKITGDLTVHGVTKPVTLDAKVNKIGLFEMPGFKAEAAGFDATTVIKRSDFGVTKFVPAVSDEIPVRITLDAKQPQARS